jgi:hypothetical protein
MHDLDSASARAVLSRISVLRDERQTKAALELLDLLESPNGMLGVVPSSAEPFSAQAAVRESADLQRAFILMRSSRAENVDDARELLDHILRRVGPNAGAPSLDGRRRQIFLGDVAIAYSFLGDESQAIAISEFLITETGAPSAEPHAVAAWVTGSEAGAAQRNFVTLQLYNNAVRRLRLAQLSLLAGRTDEAGVLLARAHGDVSCALHLFELFLPPDESQSARTERFRHARQAVVGRIELEKVLLLPMASRAAPLAGARRLLEDLVRATDLRMTAKPSMRLLRHAALGASICEQALLAEHDGDLDRAQALAWTARALVKPYVDLYVADADEYVGYVVRYGAACRICGATGIARKVWMRSRDRLGLRHHEDHEAVASLDALIAALPHG